MKLAQTRILFNRKNENDLKTDIPVHIEVYYKGKRKYILTGVKIKLNQWDNTNKKAKGTSTDNNLNYKISSIKNKIDDFIIDLDRAGDEFSFVKLQSFLDGNNHGVESFLDFILDRISKKNLKHSTEKKLMSLYNNLEKFGKMKTFSDVTLEHLNAFNDYLRIDRDNTQSTLYYRHKQLRSFINDAVTAGYVKENPYSKFKIAKGKFAVRRFLNRDELKSLEEANITIDPVEKARDLFIFCTYTGLSYSDLAKFDVKKVTKIDDDYFIEDTREKTGEPFYILILPKAYSILEKYDFVLPVMSNAKYNEYIKVAAAFAKINKNLTTHMARHTFATTILLDNDVPLEIVQRLMAHSSIRTTQIYAQISQKNTTKHMQRLKSDFNKEK